MAICGFSSDYKVAVAIHNYPIHILVRTTGKSTALLRRVSRFLSDFKPVLPIFLSAFAGYYTLVMLVAFGWLGRTILVTQLSIASYFAFRHAIQHHSMLFSASLSSERMLEAREYVIRLFQEEVNT